MKKIYFGNDRNNKRIELDLEEEKIHFILLTGATNGGKSIMHNFIYKQLSENYSPEEIGFVFLDMTRVDFTDWKSEYLYKPVEVDPVKAINLLHKLAEEKTNKKIFVHIEECDMVYKDPGSLEKAYDKLRKNKDIYIVYSTSRLDRGYLSVWMKKYIDMKIVYAVATREDSEFILGNTSAYFFQNEEVLQGEKIIAYSNKQVYCKPFGNDAAKGLINFQLK